MERTVEYDNDHPRVFFPSDSPGDFITVGFLFMVDGVLWAAKTLDDARAHVPAIPISLDPKLLESLPDTKQGELQFKYLGLVPRR
jgi:hypothetical protein